MMEHKPSKLTSEQAAKLYDVGDVLSILKFKGMHAFAAGEEDALAMAMNERIAMDKANPLVMTTSKPKTTLLENEDKMPDFQLFKLGTKQMKRAVIDSRLGTVHYRSNNC